MRVLILGYSKFVQNRVLAGLSKFPEISVDIASVSGAKVNLPQAGFINRIFSNYGEAFTQSRAELAYVSTVNSLHADLAEKALRKGLHVIVDKPAFTDYRDAVRLTRLADKSKLCLAESNIYAYHRQIDLIKRIFKQAGDFPKKLVAVFSFPALDPDNFRYSKKLGGGALWDLGPYAVSVGRLFFENPPQKILAHACRNPAGLDISFSLLALYSGGRSMVGEFGFGTEYRNHLNILGSKTSVNLNRVFTTPPEMENEIHVSQQNKAGILKVERSDNFYNFFAKFSRAVKEKNFEFFSRQLLGDALALKRLRRAAL